MIATFLNELFAAAVATLPRLFLLGAPVLLLAIVLAAIADWKLANAGMRWCECRHSARVQRVEESRSSR